VRKTIIWLFPVLFFLSFVGCSQNDVLSDFSKTYGTDLNGGSIISDDDSHGGFHGDGYRLTVAEYPDDSVVSRVLADERWRGLPLSANLNTFIYQPYDDSISIPAIENGYYFFYDRHAGSDSPYDDAELLSRFSFNFTLAVLDSDANRLYLLVYDT